MASHDFDIVMVSDFRFPGGTSASMAEEIRAQAAAGYSTGLVQVATPLLANARGFNKRIRHSIEAGMARLVSPGADQVRAKLVVFRHPGVFDRPPSQVPRLRSEHSILVANQSPADATGREVHYEVARVAQNVDELSGREVEWAPIGPLVRATVAGRGVPVRDSDWHNVVDMSAWKADRTRFVADRPVIGRHSRPQWQKWPGSREDLLAAYPADGEFIVRILGGAEAVRDILGEIPAAWQVQPFDAAPVPDFLRAIDFFVYFHHRDLIEAFGRNILEALASGAVAVVPEHFRALFGDSCVYSTPQEVRRIVRELHADKPSYDAQSDRAKDHVRQHFSHQTHQRRLEALIGAPSAAPRSPARSTPIARERILFVSSNGGGMGHLTRLLAMARRASERYQPMFLSLSQAVPVVAAEGFPYEYFASRAHMGVSVPDWNRMFAARLSEIMSVHHPKALVFDGTWPWDAFAIAREAHPEVAFVWSRRGMWRAGANREQLDKATWFDMVVEPGEFSAAADRGFTRAVQDVVRVGPITLLDPDELLPRDKAMHELGLDASRPAVLVTLGAGNINDIVGDLQTFVSVLSRDPERQICITQPIIAVRGIAAEGSVQRLSRYPLSRYLQAFDFAVAAAGYNSFHELVGNAIPTAFVPNLATALDDQESRARYAAEVGAAVCLTQVNETAAAAAVERLSDVSARSAIASACRGRYPGNGAPAAMQAIERLAAGGRAPALPRDAR